MSRDPVGTLEWQEAADAAHGALALDAARTYGFVSGGPKVDIVRCEEILRRAATLGITPAADAIERFIVSAGQR